MPTIIKADGGTQNVSDAFAKVLAQNGPLQQAHAEYYGAAAAKQREELEASRIKNSAERYLAENGPDAPGAGKAAMVAQRMKELLDLRQYETVTKYGVNDPRATASQAGNGMAWDEHDRRSARGGGRNEPSPRCRRG